MNEEVVLRSGQGAVVENSEVRNTAGSSHKSSLQVINKNILMHLTTGEGGDLVQPSGTALGIHMRQSE